MAEFILDPHRANVAFTRSKQRLIVVCARDLLDVAPTAYERYQDAVLWKLLRHLCAPGRHQDGRWRDRPCLRPRGKRPRGDGL
jgi:hypothetical protein